MFANLGSTIAGLMFAFAMFTRFVPPELRTLVRKYTRKLANLINPYIQITFDELAGEKLQRSDTYSNIRSYLSEKSSTHAKRLKADVVEDSQAPVLCMDNFEEVIDDFNGVNVWWSSIMFTRETKSISYHPIPDEKRYYKLKFHKHHRETITKFYIAHVMREGKAIADRNRRRKLYTNNPSDNWRGSQTQWSHVNFEHPATFDTLAMELEKKEEIKKDLIMFSESKDYYRKIGKAWKRGYLLYGPPGTGKSTMIAAMANLLNYDVYDLELTTVKNNTDLKKLFIATANKSIIVIEDIDCSLDLTGKRKEKKKKKETEEKKDPAKKTKMKGEERKDSKVTLSGLLNFIDGIWSACGGEKIIVFTTNYVEKLDPALIRRGRMDKHIEMSYCGFEAFKVLAKNYLDVESHELFARIGHLLEETKMSPADVAENLMRKSYDENEMENCLRNLIEALEAKKAEEEKKKAEEEARLKAEQEEKEKEESVEAKKAEEEKEEEKKKAEEEARLKAEQEEKEKEESVEAKKAEEKKKKAEEEARLKAEKEESVQEVVVEDNGATKKPVKENGFVANGHQLLVV